MDSFRARCRRRWSARPGACPARVARPIPRPPEPARWPRGRRSGPCGPVRPGALIALNAAMERAARSAVLVSTTATTMITAPIASASESSPNTAERTATAMSNSCRGSVKDSSSSFHHGSDLRGAMVLGPWWGPASGPLVLIQAQRGRSSTTPRRAVGPRRATPVRRRGSPLVRSCRRRLLLGPGREVTLTLGWGRCASAG